MRQIFKIFFAAEGTRPWLVLLCLLFGGIAEAVGIGTMLPLLTTIVSSEVGQPSVFESAIRSFFDFLGLTPTFLNTILLIVAIMLARSLLLFAAMSYAGITAARVAIGFRRSLINAILEARWSYYANQSTGQLATSIGNDATLAGQAYLAFATAAACATQIFAYAAVALLINSKVALAGIAGGLFIAFSTSKLLEIARRSGFKMTDRIGALSSDLVDVLGNIKALKSMHRYAPTLDHVDHLIKRLKKAMFAQSLSRYGLTYASDFLVALLVALGAYVAIVVAKVPVASVLVIGVLFFQVISYAAKLQKQAQAAAQFEGAYVRISNAVKHARSEQEVLQGDKTPVIGKGISFSRVDFSHGPTKVLNGLSIDIPANGITVIQGPSGAGKTTLLDLLVGFHKPQSGTITIGGVDLNEIDIHKWRSMIGYVPQELALFHDSVRDNITLYDESLSDAAILNAAGLSGVSGFLDKLPNGLQTSVGEFGGKLSGGQRQRISLARALVTNPQLLILDEVTSALDPETEDAIVSNIAELRGRYTIIAITHRPAWTRIAGRLYTLKNGRAELLKKSKKK